jgi:6-phosphogluconolactonase
MRTLDEEARRQMTDPAKGECVIVADAQALAQQAAVWLTDEVLATEGAVAVCLSGGSTPRQLYGLLAERPHVEMFPWQRVHWFWGDERFVPHDDPRSNYRMVREAMLDRAPVPPANVHPIPTGAEGPNAAAAEYECELQRFYGATTLDPGRPLFAATILGLGEDGHTASLFPGSPALAERTRWVAAVTGPVPEPRITLTYPALESSGAAAFLVSGSAKRDILTRVRRGEDLPAAKLRPVGRLRWMVDRAAAGEAAV